MKYFKMTEGKKMSKVKTNVFKNSVCSNPEITET